MTFDIENWLNIAVNKLRHIFLKRLLFIGLQGSYNRGEATPESDIDLVVILDVLNFDDLKQYKEIISAMPDGDKACGFISGKKELQNWSKADLFQFFYDTKPLYGNLTDIIQPPEKNDIKQSVKINSENLYHAAVHSFVHSKNYREDLQNLYKMTFFILQARYFIETGKYIKTKGELLKYLKAPDREILDICIKRQFGNNEFESLYEKLISWSSYHI